MTEPETNPGLESAVPDEPNSNEAPELDPERARRANRATRGGLAGLLCLEAFVVLLVPRAIAQTSTGVNGAKTALLVALALVLIVTGFLLRRPWGIGLASGLQLVLVATVILIPPIAVVVVFFLLIWWYLLRTRHQLVGTPSGWRMLVS
jgi:hypothetical protein